ncbi:MAG: rhodanese-like domain-containing protein [Granulosicoccus sp.]
MQPSLALYTLTGMLLLSTVTLAQSLEHYDVDQTTGFRMERYRAPVPLDIPDATTLDTPAAMTLHAQGTAVFIDVYPPKGLGPDPLDGHWVITEQRQSIPGAVWLPEVGRGSLQPEALEYFSRNLNRLTEGNRQRALVFFCTADCWQSWNATRRASALGYTSVHWFPLGSDGWLENDQTLSPVYPVNFLNDSVDAPDNQDSSQ